MPGRNTTPALRDIPISEVLAGKNFTQKPRLCVSTLTAGANLLKDFG
jgi:hypothetical protein